MCEKCWPEIQLSDLIEKKTCETCEKLFNVHKFCDHCNTCDSCCTCPACPSCEYKTQQDFCDNCEFCESCCSCVTCSTCNELFLNEDFCHECDRCKPHCRCGEGDRYGINSYSFDVMNKLTFKGDAKEKPSRFNKKPIQNLFFGIELEVESDKDNAVRCKDLLGRDFIVCKYDGSVSYGFEMVSAPSTLDYHQTAWDEFFDKKPTDMKSWNTDTCGMHVHISRKPLSKLTIAKMLVFLNSDENRKFIVSVAGRTCDSYAKIQKKKLTDVNKSYERYQALNLQNINTVEVRIFKGTLNKVTFLKNIEFCHAMVYFCKNTSATKLFHEDFIHYVMKFRKQYPNLVSWMTNKNWIKSEIKDLTFLEGDK